MNTWTAMLKIVLGFPTELFAAAILHGLFLEKREGSLLRLFAGAAVLSGLYGIGLYAFASLVPPSGARQLFISLAYSMLGYVFLLFFGMFWRRISWRESVILASNAYLTQHLAYCCFSLWKPQMQLRLLSVDLWYFLIFGGIYAACWFFFARRMPEGGHFDTRTGIAVGSSVSAILFAIVLSALSQHVQKESAYLYAICQLYAMGICFYILWNQLEQKKHLRLSQELYMQQELFRKHREQYEMSAENVELINRKCHDLKHQIAALGHIRDESARQKYIEELKHAVMIYDSVVKTGNEVLDTILTEKSLICEARQIQFSCVADGEALAFMDAMDVYTIFGNAIDNAVESAGSLPDPQMRTISLLVARKGDMVMIQTENYCGEEPGMQNGLPVTSKKEEKGYHGFGLKSIRYTAEKYGGFMTVEAAHGIFMLRVVVPVSASPKA